MYVYNIDELGQPPVESREGSRRVTMLSQDWKVLSNTKIQFKSRPEDGEGEVI